MQCLDFNAADVSVPLYFYLVVLQHGFGMIDKLGGIRAIQSHVATMTEYLYDRMSNLRHSNGKPMLQIFGKHHFQNSREVRTRQGGPGC
jgi:molybdenum cofactor sulfurtransferase